jgi:hypothetical protein
MVDPAVLTGPLDGADIRGLLDHADHGLVPALVGADGTGVVLGEVGADRTAADALDETGESGGQAAALLGRLLEQVVGEPKGRLAPDAGKLGELGGEVVDGGQGRGRVEGSGFRVQGPQKTNFHSRSRPRRRRPPDAPEEFRVFRVIRVIRGISCLSGTQLTKKTGHHG